MQLQAIDTTDDELRALYAEVRECFVSRAGDQAADLAAAVAALPSREAIAQVEIVAHTIKGSADIAGFTDLTPLAREAEAAARSATPNQALIRHFARALAAALQVIAASWTLDGRTC